MRGILIDKDSFDTCEAFANPYKVTIAGIPVGMIDDQSIHTTGHSDENEPNCGGDDTSIAANITIGGGPLRAEGAACGCNNNAHVYARGPLYTPALAPLIDLVRIPL